ncbi:MAG: outer membrane protein transport protein, partial [Thiohalobacterales bacterium]|nr:outer membrane protein transport protein [Thiohalobacterales bacterium]
PPPNGPGIPPNQVPEGTTVNDLLDASVPDATFRPVSDTGTLSVDLKQALFVPTLSFKFNDQHTFGASLLLGLQRFQARGLGNFQCFTDSVQNNPSPPCPAFALTPSDSLTNNGYDWSYGAGVRVGWIGDVHPRLTLGAAASSKVYMTEFDDYEELFAEEGDFDIPASFTLGATFKATSQLNLSFDFQRIFYEGVDSISNEGPIFVPGVGPFPPSGPPPGSNTEWLGKDNGMGFGWEDINVYRLGAEYLYNKQWTWRAGFLYTDQVIPDDQVLFNILAPATVQKHVTFGFTFSPDSNSEWNFAYMHAFKETVDSSETAFGVPGEIEMHQNSVDFSYSYKF